LVQTISGDRTYRGGHHIYRIRGVYPRLLLRTSLPSRP